MCVLLLCMHESFNLESDIGMRLRDLCFSRTCKFEPISTSGRRSRYGSHEDLGSSSSVLVRHVSDRGRSFEAVLTNLSSIFFCDISSVKLRVSLAQEVAILQ